MSGRSADSRRTLHMTSLALALKSNDAPGAVKSTKDSKWPTACTEAMAACGVAKLRQATPVGLWPQSSTPRSRAQLRTLPAAVRHASAKESLEIAQLALACCALRLPANECTPVTDGSRRHNLGCKTGLGTAGRPWWCRPTGTTCTCPPKGRERTYN